MSSVRKGDPNDPANPSSLTAALINIRSRKDPTVYADWALNNKIDLLILTEVSDQVPLNDNYVVYQNSDRNLGTAMIVLNKDIVLTCPYASNNHVTVKIGKPSVLINGWYVPIPQSNHPATKLIEEELETLLRKKKRNVIHIGDMNARSRALEQIQTPRGENLYQALTHGSFTLLNEPNVFTFHSILRDGTTHGESVIDWVIVSNSLAGKTELEVLPPIFGSDHSTLILTINNECQTKSSEQKEVIAPGPFLREIKKLNRDGTIANWFERYTEAIQKAKKLAKKRAMMNMSEQLVFLKTEINKLTQRIRKQKDCDPQLKCALTDLTKLFDAQYNEHKKLQASMAIRQASTPKQLSKLKTSTKNTDKLTMLSHNGEQHTGDAAADKLMKKFFPHEDEVNWQMPKKLPPDDSPLTRVEITLAMNRMNQKAAPGCSGVSISLIKQWHAAMPEYFTMLFNDWWSQCIFPEELKQSLVIALIKNKSKLPTLENVRPISISEAIGRWYEKVVDTRLMYHVESKKLLTNEQFGFREGLSAKEALMELQKIRERNELKYELLVQTDIKAAFDSLKHEAILDTLVKLEIPGNIIKIIYTFLRERKAIMSLGENWMDRIVRRGVPQGSCLGPHLYILTTDLMLRQLKLKIMSSVSTRSDMIAYADDVLLITASKNKEWAIKKAQQLVDVMDREATKLGLELSREKLKFMLNKENVSAITWKGQQIDLQKSMKHLGVVFSPGLTFECHWEYIEEKCNDWLQANSKVLNPFSKLSYEARRDLLVTTLIPMITYGVATWYKDRDVPQSKVIDRIGRKIAQAMTAANDKTGYRSTAILSKKLPLHLECRKRKLIDTIQAAGKHGDEFIEKKLKTFEVNHPSKLRTIPFLPTLHTDEEVRGLGAEVLLFTDGSQYNCENQTVSGAAIVQKNKRAGTNEYVTILTKKYKLGPNNTVYQCEMHAIKQALKMASEMGAGLTVALLTDSLSNLMAIHNSCPDHPYINECQKLYWKAKDKGVNIVLAHVKAHVDITGNEEADAAAKDAAIEGTLVTLPIPMATVKRKITKDLYKEYEIWFNKTKTGAHIKQFFDGPNDPKLRPIKTNWATTATYTGHGNNLASFKYGYSTNEKCSCGEKVQTMKHLLFECKKLEKNNVATARNCGIPSYEFFVPWEQLKTHKRLHHYIAERSLSAYHEIKHINAFFPQLREITIAMENLCIGTSASEDSSAQHETSYSPWPNHEKYELYSDRMLYQWNTDSQWTDGTPEGGPPKDSADLTTFGTFNVQIEPVEHLLESLTARTS